MIHRVPYVYVRGEFEKLERLTEDEIGQLTEAGFDTAEVLDRLEAARGSSDFGKMRAIYQSLGQLSRRSDFPYEEPSDYDGIVAARPGQPPRWELSLSGGEPAGLLSDRLYGAWLGRCAGNCLGRPVENWTRDQIKTRLDLTGDYPLTDYFPVIDLVPDSAPEWLTKKLTGTAENRDLRPNINGMVRDDDTDYTIIGLEILERHGRDFTTIDVGRAWLRLFPFQSVHTAERVAYINLVNNLAPPETANVDNPYREWIGAQIRADMWGFVNPGNPDAAAEMAFRDAALSHTANGIYGEMAAAAMIAASFATADPVEVANAGIAVVPQKSRLAEILRDTIGWAESAPEWGAVWDNIDAAFVNHHPVHTLPNIAVVVLALLCGSGDFEKSIAISVMAGFDTDCNGATVGSILGTMLGAKALPGKWIDPLKDQIRSEVAGFDGSQISDLAKRTEKYLE